MKNEILAEALQGASKKAQTENERRLVAALASFMGAATLTAIQATGDQVVERLAAVGAEREAEGKKKRLEKTPLGKVQKGVLASLRRHGAYPGGWVWDTHSGTVKILEGLVARGLVKLSPVPSPYGKGTYEKYFLSVAGEKMLAELKQAHDKAVRNL